MLREKLALSSQARYLFSRINDKFLTKKKIQLKFETLIGSMGVRRKKCRGGQKHSRDGHLSESYSQVSVSDRVTN